MIAGIVKDRGVKYHRIGIEERVRFFIADGIRKGRRHAEVVDATSRDGRLPDDQIEGRDRA